MIRLLGISRVLTVFIALYMHSIIRLSYQYMFESLLYGVCMVIEEALQVSIWAVYSSFRAL